VQLAFDRVAALQFRREGDLNRPFEDGELLSAAEREGVHAVRRVVGGNELGSIERQLRRDDEVVERLVGVDVPAAFDRGAYDAFDIGRVALGDRAGKLDQLLSRDVVSRAAA
jgi:hypothetical protein